MKLKILIILVLTIGQTNYIHAQIERNNTLIKSELNGWQYEIRAGVNIGGASPIVLPREIRSIEMYKPKFNGTMEGIVTKWLGKKYKWGVSAALKIEEKGMQTEAKVKNYKMEIMQDGAHVAGYWSGRVKTDYTATMITMPLTLSIRIDKRWTIRTGLYTSLVLDNDFSGYVSNGYLRHGTPVGEKSSFTGEQIAAYDFSNELRKWQWGVQAGFSWKAFKRLLLTADMTWGMNNVFKKDFKSRTITFNMYPIYLNIGFGYQF